jgi:hypothetical protein
MGKQRKLALLCRSRIAGVPPPQIPTTEKGYRIQISLSRIFLDGSGTGQLSLRTRALPKLIMLSFQIPFTLDFWLLSSQDIYVQNIWFSTRACQTGDAFQSPKIFTRVRLLRLKWSKSLSVFVWGGSGGTTHFFWNFYFL